MGQKSTQAGGGQARQSLLSQSDLHVMRLGGLLDDLVRQHGRTRAAQELGVSYKTLHRSELAGTMSDALRDALERYLWAGPKRVDSPWWKRVEHAEAEMRAFKSEVRGDVEQVRQAVRELADDVALQRAHLDRELASVRRQLNEVQETAVEAREMATEARAVSVETREHRSNLNLQTPVPTPLQTPRIEVAGPATRYSARIQPHVLADEASERLVSAWKEAGESHNSAKTRIERVDAELAQLRIGLELVREHWLVMPGPQRLDQFQRSRELERHWVRTNTVRRERDRLVLRRWSRRVLTLGLWWK